jgi:Arc/MetJ-type ribon-helix-helix transcriptional regulator
MNMRTKVANGKLGDGADVVREALRLLDEHDRRRWLTQALAEGERRDAIDLTPELMDQLSREAEENAALGTPVRDAIKP